MYMYMYMYTIMLLYRYECVLTIGLGRLVGGLTVLLLEISYNNKNILQNSDG